MLPWISDFVFFFIVIEYNKYSNHVFRLFSFFFSLILDSLIFVVAFNVHTAQMQQPLSAFQRFRRVRQKVDEECMHCHRKRKTKTVTTFNGDGTHREPSIFHNIVLIMFPAFHFIPFVSFVPISPHALFYAFQFVAQCTQVVIYACFNSLRSSQTLSQFLGIFPHGNKYIFSFIL